jgi:uncharacterized protein YcsI (UPF0317 family)
MRPIPGSLVSRAVDVTSRVPAGHGAPVHIGAPEAIGIEDLAQVDYGDVPRLAPGDVPVFWACGVTPQAAAENGSTDLMITHAPGHMYVTDTLTSSLPDGRYTGASCGY